MELRVWPEKGTPRILGIPDAAFRNNSDKSSQRAMTIFIADERVKNRRDTIALWVFFESTDEVFWCLSDASRIVEGHQWNGC